MPEVWYNYCNLFYEKQNNVLVLPFYCLVCHYSIFPFINWKDTELENIKSFTCNVTFSKKSYKTHQLKHTGILQLTEHGVVALQTIKNFKTRKQNGVFNCTDDNPE